MTQKHGRDLRSADSRRARRRRLNLETLERRIRHAETALILLTIAVIATGDHLVGASTSLGPLYLIPLSYSALTHRLRTTLVLVALCVVLRQWHGPLQASALPLATFVRDLGLTGLFLLPVVYLYRLGRLRSDFFELARRQRDELEHEVEMAAGVQQRMLALGGSPVRDLDVVARTRPLKGVGGDYYDCIEGNDGRVFVVIADVAGKGLPAALLMPAVRIGLRAAAELASDLSGTVGELSRILYDTTEPSSYATLFIAGIDARVGDVEYVSAGHLPGLIVDARGEARWLREGGVPIGLLEDSVYESAHETLGEGAVLLLYTDGVTEAQDAEGTEFGTERLLDVVAGVREQSAEAVVSAVQAAVERFTGEGEHTDDTTVIAIKRRPGAPR